eukprot:CAMPEP_0182938660 /NCGR_PEP_ID=MMETSP0105_2-20130417/44261_1 /TAXON_ID=81532 ORGANISM="Acanthoeca-like sp., Strain 10tr" /NCGR_SAMPLE_ID=MMETSP0105_2 /ASSEMBLY_ACC=CAM_ASM_000205 /LENGTH=102 /DNA_ID=CAMNT_0025077987 /DNA_START=72 /DNA_END=378 /DNA_ORIENTATION=+
MPLRPPAADTVKRPKEDRSSHHCGRDPSAHVTDATPRRHQSASGSPSRRGGDVEQRALAGRPDSPDPRERGAPDALKSAQTVALREEHLHPVRVHPRAVRHL